MTITVHCLREHKVCLAVHSGRITPQDLLDHVRTVNADDVAATGTWITYFDDSVDVSDVTIDALIAAKRLVTERTPAPLKGGRLRSALVCSSRKNLPYVGLALAHNRADPDYPADAAAVPSLKQACDRLGLDERARLAMEAIVARTQREDARPAAPPR